MSVHVTVPRPYVHVEFGHFNLNTWAKVSIAKQNSEFLFMTINSVL